MNISIATKNRLQIKTENALVYLANDMTDLGDGDLMCLAKPEAKYYPDQILFTAGEYDIKDTIVFGYRLSNQVVYQIVAEEINVVFVSEALDVEKEKDDVKVLDKISQCDILLTNIENIKEISPIVNALAPSIICVNESFEDSDSHEKMKTFKIKSIESSEEDTAKYIVLQK